MTAKRLAPDFLIPMHLSKSYHLRTVDLYTEHHRHPPVAATSRAGTAHGKGRGRLAPTAGKQRNR